jgi:chaperonin GroES
MQRLNNIELRHGRLLVELVRDSGRSASGLIIIPREAIPLPCQGIVRAIAPDCELDIVVGDTLLFSRYAGIELTIDNVEHVILDQEEALARLGDFEPELERLPKRYELPADWLLLRIMRYMGTVLPASAKIVAASVGLTEGQVDRVCIYVEDK